MANVKALSTEIPGTPAVLPPVAFDWSFTYDGPVAKVDDPTCDLCIAVRAGKCLKNATQHGGAGCTPACSTGQAARMGMCHNHHGIEGSLKAHPTDHAIDAAHRPTFDAVSRSVLDTVAALPTDTKRVHVRAVAVQNHELTQQNVTIEIKSWR